MKSLFYVSLIGFVLLSGCTNDQNIADNVEHIITSLESNQSFRQFVKLQSDFKSEQIGFYREMIRSGQKQNATFEKFAEEKGFETVDAYQEHMTAMHLRYLDRIFLEVEELSFLTSNTFADVWQNAAARRPSVVLRDVGAYVQCMNNASSDHDQEVSFCVAEYNNGGSGRAYGACLNTASSNYAYNISGCTVE